MSRLRRLNDWPAEPLPVRLPQMALCRCGASAVRPEEVHPEMVVEYIRYRIPAEQAAAFEEAYVRAAASLAASEHCLAWELARCVEDEMQYILRIEWDSLEGHERGFRSSPQFASFLASVQPFYGAIEEMRHYGQTSVVGGRQG